MGTPLVLYQAADAAIACRGRVGRLWIVVQAANICFERCRVVGAPWCPISALSYKPTLWLRTDVRYFPGTLIGCSSM